MPSFKIKTIAKIISAMVVILAMIVTWVLTWHITVEPMDGALSKIIPEPGSVNKQKSTTHLASILMSDVMPDIDPGERAFESAFQLLQNDQIDEAREKLITIYNIYPNSSSAATARRIVGEMNLDQLLSNQNMQGKLVHTVRGGDSYLGIAAKHQTTIDCMLHLNSMLELEGIQPGDRLVVMPLNLKVLIEPRRQAVSLWNDGQFIREYPAVSMRGVRSRKRTTSIQALIAESNGSKVLAHAQNYPAARKIIQIASPALQIRAWEESEEELPNGILLRPRDMQEIALLTRVGNSVEFR